MKRLDGKIALIAGGGADGPPNTGEPLSIGNGRATAIMAAREGALVMAADLNLTLARQTADAIVAEGGKAAAIACDVSKEDDCRRAVADTVKQFGALHLLVNNVGIAAGGSLLNTTTDQFEKVYSVNLRSHFLMMRYAVPGDDGADEERRPHRAVAQQPRLDDVAEEVAHPRVSQVLSMPTTTPVSAGWCAWASCCSSPAITRTRPFTCSTSTRLPYRALSTSDWMIWSVRPAATRPAAT